MPSPTARLLVGSAILVALTACPQPASVISVTILGGDLVLPPNTSRVLEADVRTIGGMDASVNWTSSDEVVATVDTDGTLTTLMPGTADITATSTADPLKVDAILVTVNAPGTPLWTRQFGTSSDDYAMGIASDAGGNVYIAGYTTGALDGVNAGGTDGFVRSYDGDGDLRWTRQFGTSNGDFAMGIASDAGGNVYIVGRTFGALEGSNLGETDGFVRSYDGGGDLRWTRQFGTSNSESAMGVASDAGGNVYIVGHTFGALEGVNRGGPDPFVRSYDSNGDLRWTRQFGTTGEDRARAVASDAGGNVYIVGYTSGTLEGVSAGNYDAFVRSYGSGGELRWTRQFGTSSEEQAIGVASDAGGNVYVGGRTFGALVGANAGDSDAFVRSYDSGGELRWTRQFGTSSGDYAWGVASDASGNICIGGHTLGALVGVSAGNYDAFVRSYEDDGDLRWTRQFGTPSRDFSRDVASDASGNFYTVGETFGALGSANAGSADSYIRTFGP